MTDPARAQGDERTSIAALPTFADAQIDAPIPRRRMLAWAAWDWGSAGFNAVITTFVFTVYLASKFFVDPRIASAAAAEKDLGGPAHRALTLAEAHLSSGVALGIGLAGIAVALLAPVLGQRTDGSGRRKLWLAINTAVVVLVSALLFFVQGEPAYFVFGVTLVAIGTVFYEIATVNYFAMIVQVSTPKTVGKVSGFGWAAGYLGGIVLLLIVYVSMIAGTGGLLHLPTAAGFNIRCVVLVCAVWTLLFSLPVLFAVPEIPPLERRVTVSFFRSYALVGRHIAALWRESRNTVLFLIASAIFRDGLSGVFTFGGILAAGTFGFSSSEVLVFGIVANVVAGVSTLIAGRLDDRFGAKSVMLVSLIGLVVAGLAIVVFHDGGQSAFWSAGLVLCLFVGPAQAASRSFLARLAPAGREGEIFGLYQTTGRAASYLAPLLFAGFSAWFGAQYWGALGIVLVLFVGLMLLIPVRGGITARSNARSGPAEPRTSRARRG